MMLGCERVFHINDRFGDDVLLAQQLGLVRIFDQSTVNRFLRTFTKWNTNQLERILMVTIQVHGQFVGLVCRILDKDSDLNSCAFAAHQVIATDFRSGNRHCSQALATVFEKALKTPGRIDLIRLDAGYISINPPIGDRRNIKIGRISQQIMALPDGMQVVQKGEVHRSRHSVSIRTEPAGFR